MFSDLNLAALEKQAGTPKISMIKNVEVVIVQDTAFKLPSTINAILSDNKTKKVSIKWDKPSPKTTKVGIVVFKGTVKGYTPKVILTLKITPKIASIANIKDSALCNSNYTLPTRIPAIFSDNSTNTVPVSWKPADIDLSKVGAYTFQGTVTGYKDKVTMNLDIKSKFKSIKNMNETIKHNQPFSLPQTVKAIALDGTESDAPIVWSQASLDTSLIGKDIIEGTVEGYPDKVYLNYNIEPTIDSIENRSLTLTKGDIYLLPKEIDAIMSDGSKQKVNVSWTPNALDLNKIGIVKINGVVDSYEKEISWTYDIRTDFSLMSRGVMYTQWGYIPISFNKNVIASYYLDNFILKDEDGIQIKIQKAVPGNTEKSCLCIIPMRNLDKNKTYTLVILKNTVQAENGDLFPDEINFVFKTNS